MAKKLNSMRILESAGIAYTVHEFSPDIHSAEGVAESVGVPPHKVFKTLVVESSESKKPLLVMTPAPSTLDVKALASAVGAKKVGMASHGDAERMTGLKVGGISALALLNKHWEVYIDETAREWETILISAGERGINLEVPVVALIDLTGAKWVNVARDE
jgi:Cys-tRNA(Pro)/Cys-tRNA(Cys) deacylase